MIKAVFFDYDGTLFRKGTSEYTRKALKELRKKGILVFLATGRHFLDLPREEDFPFQYDAYVMLNGQMCICGGEILYDNLIPADAAQRLLVYLKTTPISCVFLKKEEIFANTETVKWFKEAKILRDKITPEGVYQIVAFANAEEQRMLQELLPECRATRWNPEGIDIISCYGSKKIGIQKIMEHFHLKQEEIMAFGDGENDIEMIAYAGIGIAMGNAVEEVKRTADYVCESIDNRGIYEGLLHYHLIETI